MLLAILVAATGLLEFRSSLQVWACHLRFRVAVFAMLITLNSQGHASPTPVRRGGGGGGGRGLHILPRGAPSRGAKLCTYLRWFARPDGVNTEPYNELALPVITVIKLRSKAFYA